MKKGLRRPVVTTGYRDPGFRSALMKKGLRPAIQSFGMNAHVFGVP